MATNGAQNIPTGASGTVLQGAGVGTAPAFSTATYPATAGTSGKVLISDGTNIVSSTPTFPNSSASSRKIIVSDGTNWVASTETWATPGTSGNVLTSDGTNWVSSSAPGGGFLMASGTLTNSQVKALHGTPVQAIAAPGSGNVIVIVCGTAKMNYGGNNAFTAAASQTIQVYYGTSINAISNSGGTSGILPNSNLVATSSQFFSIIANTGAGGAQQGAYSTYNNVAINLYNSVATEISGNAANNNTVSWQLQYFITSI